MSEHLVWWVGNVEPSITETLTYTDGTPVDLSSSTVQFKMRQTGTDVLTVDEPAIIVSAVDGTLRYDWSAADVDTPGFYLLWWEVTDSNGTQDMGETLIDLRAHAPGTNAYLELEEAKSTLEIDVGHADNDLQTALVAASRVVDEITGTRFYTTTSDEERYYTPDSTRLLYTDEINTLTELAVGPGDDTFSTVWTENTDFVLEPLNAVVALRPWDRVRAVNGNSFSVYPRTVRITGKFGWAAPPEAVKAATSIIATKIMRRARSAPMGIITAFDGTAVRMNRFDPQVEELLGPYNRSTPYA